MFLISAYYFVFFAAFACFMPYLSLYYQTIGMTGSQIGIVNGITPLVSMVFAPIWSGIADATRRHKLILMVGMLGIIGIAFGLPFIREFRFILPVMIVYTVFSSPVMPIVDSNAVAVLGEKRDKYGRVRMWGTISYAIMSPLIGELVHATSISWAFWIYASWMFLGLFIVIPMPINVERTMVPLTQGIKMLMNNRRWIFFLAMVLIAGMGIAISQNYLFIYLKSLNASESIMGLSLTISTLGEIPILFFGNRLLRRFGAKTLMHFSMFATGLRLISTSLAPAAWLVIVVQVLHGLTFPLLLIAGISYGNEVAPSGMRATTQGMFNSVYFGFSFALGGFLGGILLEKLDIKNTFLWGGLFVLAGAILFAVVSLLKQQEPG